MDENENYDEFVQQNVEENEKTGVNPVNFWIKT